MYMYIPPPRIPVCGACEIELYENLFPTPPHEIAG